MAKLFSFVLPLDIYSLGLIAMVEEGYNQRDYGEHVASSAYSVDPPSDFPNYAGDTRRAEAAQGLFARQRHQWLLPTEFVGHY